MTERGNSRYERQVLRTPSRPLAGETQRDRDVNTVWVTQHLLKDFDDLRAVLALPAPEPETQLDVVPILQTEAALGDSGIVMIDTPDPLCLGAELFDVAKFTVIALTEPALFTALLE